MNAYRFEEITIGQEERFTVKITEQMLDTFGEMTGDVNPLHHDAAFARKQGYEKRVAFGMLTASFLSTLAGVWLPGRYSLIHEVESKFVKPVFPGDELTVTGTVTEKNETFQVITIKVEMRRQNGEKVLRGKMKVGFLNESK